MKSDYKKVMLLFEFKFFQYKNKARKLFRKFNVENYKTLKTFISSGKDEHYLNNLINYKIF